MKRLRSGGLVLALAMWPLAALAQQQPPQPASLPERQANYAWDKDLLRASFSYRDVLADPALARKLSSGLPMVIAMRAYVYEEGQDKPLALAPRV